VSQAIHIEITPPLALTVLVSKFVALGNFTFWEKICGVKILDLFGCQVIPAKTTAAANPQAIGRRVEVQVLYDAEMDKRS
jgi:hypothetical protein